MMGREVYLLIDMAGNGDIFNVDLDCSDAGKSGMRCGDAEALDRNLETMVSA